MPLHTSASTPCYARQVQIPDIGQAGQERLAAAHVVVVGAGGLGVPVLTYLAAAGVGRLTVWDFDTVQESNLNRQFFYTPQDVGKPKAELACVRLRHMYPLVHCEARQEKIHEQGLSAYSIDALVCCVDNFSTRRMLNSYALQQGLWLIDGGVDGFYGSVQAVQGTDCKGACLACVQGLGATEHVQEAASPIAALGAVCGLIASLQASLCLQILLGIQGDCHTFLWQYDGKACELEKIPLRQNPACKEHGNSRK